MGYFRVLAAVLILAGAGVEAPGQEPLPRNVRIVVTGTNERTGSRQGVEASAGGRVGDVQVGVGRYPPQSGVVVRGDATRTRSNGQTRQELLVMSGGRAEISVAEEVPYQEWFAVWGQGHGLWQPGIAWKQVGARLLVEPTVVGEGTLRVRLTPAFSYWLDQRSLTTEVSQLTTEVMVREGQEIDLGGVDTPDRQFLERFLVGFNESHEASRLRISLRASIE